MAGRQHQSLTTRGATVKRSEYYHSRPSPRPLLRFASDWQNPTMLAETESLGQVVPLTTNRLRRKVSADLHRRRQRSKVLKRPALH